MLLAALLIQAAAPPQGEPPRIPQRPRCAIEVGEGSRKVFQYRGDRICVDFDKARIFEGIWIDEFEGQAFAEGATSSADLKPGTRRPWFNTYEALKPFTKPTGSRSSTRGQLYKVKFVGRQAVDMDRQTLHGYGHFNMSPGLILLDEMLSIEMLDAGSTQ